MGFWTWFKSLFSTSVGKVFLGAGNAVVEAVGIEVANILVETANVYVAQAETTYGAGKGTEKMESVVNRLALVAAREAGKQVSKGILQTVAQNAWQSSQPTPSSTN